MDYRYIQNDRDLAECCAQFESTTYIAIDTEFIRTRTFYPHCGLIQIHDGTQTYLIDPLNIDDWEPLRSVLTNSAIVKVLHSCSEDLEVFSFLLDVFPTPLFDTQFAAALMGYGVSLGYAKLVEEMLQVQLDKGESRTDWLKRPLSTEQLHYAANDVIHLHQLYPLLQTQLQDSGRFDWVLMEGESLIQKKSASLPVEYRYLGVKNSWQLYGKHLLALKNLAAWRAQKAIDEDTALNFIIREPSMIEICRKLPTHNSLLQSQAHMRSKEIRLYGETIIDIVRRAMEASDDEYPKRIQRLIDVRAYKKISHMIRAKCVELAEQHSVPLELLASKKQVQQFLKWLWFDIEECKIQGIKPDLMSGWRFQILKEVLEELR